MLLELKGMSNKKMPFSRGKREKKLFLDDFSRRNPLFPLGNARFSTIDAVFPQGKLDFRKLGPAVSALTTGGQHRIFVVLNLENTSANTAFTLTDGSCGIPTSEKRFILF